MNRRILVLAAACAIAAAAHAPALAQKVHVDYDPDFDADSIETFSWTFTPETSLAEMSPFLHSRIVNAVEYHLNTAGLRQVDRDADIQVTYHASASEGLRLDTDYWGYGYPAGWRAYGYARPAYSTTTVTQVIQGTLIVDVWDARSKKLVWRGTATLDAIRDPTVVDKKVDRAIEKMVKKWRKIRKKEGR